MALLCIRCGSVMEHCCADSDDTGSYEEWMECPRCDTTCDTSGIWWKNKGAKQ